MTLPLSIFTVMAIFGRATAIDGKIRYPTKPAKSSLYEIKPPGLKSLNIIPKIKVISIPEKNGGTAMIT